MILFTPHLKVKHVPKCKGFDGVECDNDKPKNKKYCRDCEKLKRHAENIKQIQNQYEKKKEQLEKEKAKRQELETDIVRLNLLPDFESNPSPKIKGWKPIRKNSKKNEPAQKRKRKVIKEKVEQGYVLCESCDRNNHNTRIDPSHIIRISDRKDLEDDPRNIIFQCAECHLKVEAWDIEGMINEDYIRDYVREVDPQFYKRMEIGFHECQDCKELVVPDLDVKRCECEGKLQRIDNKAIIFNYLLNKDTKKLC